MKSYHDFHRNGVSKDNFLAVPMVVTPDNTTSTHKLLRMLTSHVMRRWKGVSWKLLTALPMMGHSLVIRNVRHWEW